MWDRIEKPVDIDTEWAMVRATDRSEFIPQQWIDLRMECVALNAVGMGFSIISYGLHFITFNDMKFSRQSINYESNSLIFKRFFV